MNYQEMSDNQINCEVGRRINFCDYLMVINGQKNYCNSWSAAGRIIEDNFISLICRKDGEWRASNTRGVLFDWIDKNPLRAAMVVFLMMKDGE